MTSTFAISKNKKGSALIVVVLAFFVITIISMGVMSLAMVNNNASRYDQKYQSSYYISEAGINYKIKDIQSSIDTILNASTDASTFFTSVENTFLSNSVYSDFSSVYGSTPHAQVRMELVNEISLNEREYRIISSGEIDGKTRNVESIIRISWQAPTEEGASPIAFIYGNSFSFNGSQVNGEGASVIVKGSLNSSNFNGGSFNGISNIYIDGNLEIGSGITIGSSTQPGDIFINGNLTISGGANFYGDIYVAGNLSSSGSPIVHVGKVYVQGSGNLMNGTFYEDVYFDGDVNLVNVRFENNVYVNSNVTLSYGPPSGDFVLYYVGSLNKTNSNIPAPTSKYVKVNVTKSIPTFTVPSYSVNLKSDQWYLENGFILKDSNFRLDVLPDNYKIVTQNTFSSIDRDNVAHNVVIISKNGDIVIKGQINTNNGNRSLSGALIAPNGSVTFVGKDFTGVVYSKDGFFVYRGGSVLNAKNWDELFTPLSMPVEFITTDESGHEGGSGGTDDNRVSFFIEPIREN